LQSRNHPYVCCEVLLAPHNTLLSVLQLKDEVESPPRIKPSKEQLVFNR
jgi:hypothetical protein